VGALARLGIDAISQPQSRVQPEPGCVAGVKQAEMAYSIETQIGRRKNQLFGCLVTPDFSATTSTKPKPLSAPRSAE
jgi:hypothetical protein